MFNSQFRDEAYQLRLLSRGNREELIEWLQWNDPNGTWTDRDSEAADEAPLTLESARKWLRKALSDSRDTCAAPLTVLPRGADADTCREWLRLVCRQFGLGFHLDTPASEYLSDDGARLPADVAGALDASIEHVFVVLGDTEPYDVCWDEFQGIVAESADPSETVD